MHQYLQLIDDTKRFGVFKGDRTGTGTQSLFGREFRFDLRNGNLPVVTTKYIHLLSVIHELIWMKNGETRLKYLLDNNVSIWNEWVLPGTEIFREVTEDELTSAVQKFIGQSFELHFGEEPGDKDWVKLDADGQHPTRVVINTKAWGDVDRFGPGPSSFDYYGMALRVRRILMGDGKLVIKDERAYKLADGDLGPVYGKTWRDIEDTRIIKKTEQEFYLSKGFTFVVDVPSVDPLTAQCVVTRRVDQLQELLNGLAYEPGEAKHNRDSRRLIISAWDPCLIDFQALPPCHAFFQFWTRELELGERMELYRAKNPGSLEKIEAEFAARGYVVDTVEHVQAWVEQYQAALDLDNIPTRAIKCKLTQRSADEFLGVPFNIAFYSILTHALANQFNMVAEELIWSGGDCHIYSNHQEQTDLQRTRAPKPTPTIRFARPGVSVLDLTADDIIVENYEFHPHIKGAVAV